VSRNRLQVARRELERLEWEHARALRQGAHHVAAGLEPAIRDARWLVEDCQAAERSASARAARRTALLLDVVLGAVALLVMAFSLGNIRHFAAGHGVVDPLPWLLAPMVDLALVGTLSADAFLSRHGEHSGAWTAALRWFAGVATLVLNDWDAVRTGAPGDVLAHTVPPLLLILLAEASPYYRRGAAAVVERVRVQTQQMRHTTDSTPSTADTAVSEAVSAPAAGSAFRAGQPAAAPMDTTPANTLATSAVGPGNDAPQTRSQQQSATADDSASAPRPRARTAAAAPRPKPLPNAVRTVRPVRTDAELLEHLRQLRTGADKPLSQRRVLAELGIGLARLRSLLDTHELSLDPLPLPAPRALHPLAKADTEQPTDASSTALTGETRAV
jgi:hypothetical protein